MDNIDAYMDALERRHGERVATEPWAVPVKKRRKSLAERFQGLRGLWPFGKSTKYINPDGSPAAPPFETPIDAKAPRTKWWWAKRIMLGLFVLFLVILAWLAITAPLSKSLEPIAAPEITLLASDGTPIARHGAVVKEPVVIAALPDYVPQAFMAIEDRRFYSHWGVDPRGVARAAWSNISGSGGTQGGSTITQQLAKISFLTPERSLTRKAREAMIAFWMEAWLTKDQILGRYLSNAYFGDNVYGLRAASLHYFYRQPENLTREQAIMLAGLVQAPSRYAPTKHWERAAKRADLVRNAMVASGYMTQAEADALPDPKLDVRRRDPLPVGTYFADWAMGQARAITETSYATHELTTTLDAGLQRDAERIVRRLVPEGAQGALVAMRPDGEVVAMVGGVDYKTSQFNRAVQAKRQPGSTFKLFVWLAALQAGMHPADAVNDSPIETGSYRPANAGDKYRGEISLEEAFVNSSNVVAVRLINELGSDKVIEEARRLGITGTLEKGDPSLALGTASVSLLDMTAAFAGLSGNSWPVVPTGFVQDEPGFWEWLFSGPDSYETRIHKDMERMLRAAVNRGTGRAAQLSIPNFGKTGTSQDGRDALFIGYAGDLVVGVWIGRDDNGAIEGVQGGGAPARIWKAFMAEAVPGSLKRRTVPAEPGGEDDEGEDNNALDRIIDGRIGDANIRFDEEEGLTISTDIEGQDIEINLGGGNGGDAVRPQEERVRERDERRQEREERRQKRQREIEERIRERLDNALEL